jgi:hypothetical protein
MELLVALSLCYWMFAFISALLTRQNVPQLGELTPPDPDAWPKLSIIIPACNEGATLEAAMISKLEEGYPNLELVLINDRSTDATGEIVDRMAARDPRVTAVHIRELPEGWLGKLNAMHVGTQRASGDYLLFSDADIHYTRGALRKAVAYCESRGFDHLAVFPELWSTGLFLDSAMVAFGRFLISAARLWKVNDPRSRAAAGVGAFNLVRRSAFAKTQGFEWLKLEAADDMALGQMMKRATHRSALAFGRGQVGLHFYRTFGELARSAEKGAAVTRFSIVIAVAMALIPILLEASPVAGLFLGGLTRGLSIAALVLAIPASLTVGRLLGLSVPACLLSPLATIPMGVALARAGILGSRRNGIRWRGTDYPAKQMREGRRYEFP